MWQAAGVSEPLLPLRVELLNDYSGVGWSWVIILAVNLSGRLVGLLETHVEEA